MNVRWALATLLVAAPALAGDLQLQKEGPATAGVGNQYAYTITVTNQPIIGCPPVDISGAGPIVRGCIFAFPRQATVVDTLPPQVALVTAVPSQGTCSGTTTVTCALGTINVSASATVTITVTAVTPGTAVNEATVTAVDGGDPDPANDTDSVTTQIGGSTVTTTTTASATTTTLLGEVCGNCVDDDGDGSIDLDDAECCAAGAIGARKLKLRVIPKNGLVHFVQLQGVLDTKLPATLAGDVTLQLSQPAVGTLVCARFPLDKLFRRKASHRFDDRNRTVGSAEGFQRAELAKAKGNATNVRARGKLVDLLELPAVGAARFALSYEDAGGPHCAAGSFSFKQARKKSLRAP
jgi:hypothetical protein